MRLQAFKLGTKKICNWMPNISGMWASQVAKIIIWITKLYLK